MGKGNSNDRMATARRTAAYAAAITVVMAAVKAAVGFFTGSSAIIADSLHSTSDLLALGMSWFGLTIAMRKPTDRFPFGFYRAETLAALACSCLIIFLGGALLIEGIGKVGDPPGLTHPAAALTTAVASAVVALFVARWEKRVSVATGSQSLGATADEARMDAVTSATVIVAVAASQFSLPYVEWVVTIGIAGFVMWVGASNAWQALLSLMDASVAPDLEKEVITIISGMPGVKFVEKLRARRSGPFYFAEGHVHVAGSMDVARSHALCHEAQRLIRERRPEVEGVILHIEPYQESRRRVLVPVDGDGDMQANVAKTFCRAGRYLIVTVENDRVDKVTVEENPFPQNGPTPGLAAMNSFVGKCRPDVALVREIGEIPFHALQDNFGKIYSAPPGTAEQAIQAYISEKLERRTSETRSCEEIQTAT